MPEAEELITDAARHATVAAQSLWRRWRGEREQAPCWLLADYRARLEYLIEAVLGRQMPVRVAQPAAHVPWLARLVRRTAAVPAATLALPANDGVAIYLPPSIPVLSDSMGGNQQDYPVLALLQGVRVLRGSVELAGQCDTPLASELYLLAEAVAADRTIRLLMPGWSALLRQLYARAGIGSLTQRDRARDPLQSEVDRLYRSLLEERPEPPVTATPRDSVAWAATTASTLATERDARRYQPVLGDAVIGRLLPPEHGPSRLAHPGAPMAATEHEQRRATLARRPRVRKSDEGEDGDEPGVWMIQTSEPQEHAEDPLGLSRPQDMEHESDAQGLSESLSELETARLVSSPGRAAETLHSDDAPPRMEAEAMTAQDGAAFAYPEWDHRLSAYHAQAVQVRVAPALSGAQAWADGALARHAATLREVRRRLGAIRPYRQVLKRQADGDEIDCDALVDARSARRAGASPETGLYQQVRPSARRLGLLLLIDASGSTDAWVAGAQRVIDVEKEAALVAACALDMARADFAIMTFSGEGPHGVQMRRVKDFGEPWSNTIMQRIAAIEPDRYTRLGGAVRHATALLARRAADSRLLLLFSDGKPNDCDRYASPYGLEDARQALIEARVQRIDPYCLTVDREAGSYLPHLFGPGHYTIVRHAQQLPVAFIEWLRGVARRATQ
ncbi:VWA domain-containing protein [Noviherbaspirillum agri]